MVEEAKDYIVKTSQSGGTMIMNKSWIPIHDYQSALDDIYQERPCGICKHYTGRSNVKCRECNDSPKQFKPDFEWRGRQ